MIKELRKAITNRSKLRNKLLKTRKEKSIKKAFQSFNLQRIVCVSLLRKTKRRFWRKLHHRVFSDNRKFWKNVGPVFSEKTFLRIQQKFFKGFQKTCGKLRYRRTQKYNRRHRNSGQQYNKLRHYRSCFNAIKKYEYHPSIKN